MRKQLLILLMVCALSLKAQTQFAPAMVLDSTHLVKQWSVSKYGGISTSYGHFNGANGAALSAPIGLQLNRRLNNNLYAFAGISAAPAFINFNRNFVATDLNKISTQGNRMNTSGFGLYTRFEAGLMYVNDARTFSISGSIGVTRSSYPLYPAVPTYQQNQPYSGGSRQ